MYQIITAMLSWFNVSLLMLSMFMIYNNGAFAEAHDKRH